ALPWHEVEGTWRGEGTTTATLETFRPNQPALYHGAWRNTGGGYGVAADVTITITGNHVGAVRRQREGDCVYQGTLVADWRVTGTYTCSFNARAGALAWSAIIGNGQAPIPCTQTTDPRLNARWLETEGVWTGRWTPRGGYGDYDGSWTHDTEGAHAG